jgi:cysteine desulfurase
LPFLDEVFGNPSSSHRYGIKARAEVEKARQNVANLLHAQAEEIIFTSGGTESNNYAIKGVAFANRHKGNHIITSSIEHPAVLEVCAWLEQQGFEVSYLPVNEQGWVEPQELEAAIKASTILVTIMHANNETGVVQPIAELSALAKKHDILFHTDAAQSLGKIDTNVDTLGVDLLSVAAHKFYGPKGIGALYIRTGTNLEKIMHGADHERNHRAGTENILEIAGIGKAAEIALQNLAINQKHYASMRDLLEEQLSNQLPQIRINGQGAERLPNTLSISVPQVEANTLLDELTEVAASAGAACHTDSIDVSVVLEAMRVPMEYAMGTIRFSTGRSTSEYDIEKAAQLFVEKVNQLLGEEQQLASISSNQEIKLTHFTHGLGCACKLRPQDLEQVLKDMPKPFDPNIVVGTEGSDDAAVYRISDTHSLVQTLDFFTPIVDDPYMFGAIAAANSLSDIYAMGAKPLFALNIVGFPDKRLPLSVLKDILRGASDKATEAGISILGGHTVEDTEPKYGMVVSALVENDQYLRNTGAHDGDMLFLTKPLGTGIISTAAKRGAASDTLVQLAAEQMATLNKDAIELGLQHGVRACTDVTGFGLLGHLREMLMSTQVGVELYLDQIPVLDGVRELARANFIPGGTQNNHQWVSEDVHYDKEISMLDQLILNDAQTSGGLLLAIPPAHKSEFLKMAAAKLKTVSFIGEFSKLNPGKIRVKSRF